MKKFHYYIYPEGDFENAKEADNPFSCWKWEMFLGCLELLSGKPRRIVTMRLPTSNAGKKRARELDEEASKDS